MKDALELVTDSTDSTAEIEDEPGPPTDGTQTGVDEDSDEGFSDGNEGADNKPNCIEKDND
jgi:hypothetical protein